MTEVGIAVAVFAFLPYCQITGANVTADIYTARASARTVAVLQFAASIVAPGFSALLVWRMWAGMLDQKDYGYTTAILQFPHWIAFLPILASLMLLAVASLITAGEAWRGARRPTTTVSSRGGCAARPASSRRGSNGDSIGSNGAASRCSASRHATARCACGWSPSWWAPTRRSARCIARS
jgi:hypothetical protein